MADPTLSEPHPDDPPPWDVTPGELRDYGPGGPYEGDYGQLLFTGLYRNPFSAIMAAANASAIARGEPGAITRDMVRLLDEYVESAAYYLDNKPEDDEAVRRAIAVLRALLPVD